MCRWVRRGLSQLLELVSPERRLWTLRFWTCADLEVRQPPALWETACWACDLGSCQEPTRHHRLAGLEGRTGQGGHLTVFLPLINFAH